MSVKRQTLWSMAPLLVATVLNLISIPLFYRYLGPNLYALLFYIGTLTGSFGFADLGLGVATGRYVGVELGRGDMEAARSYWGTGNAFAIPLLAGMSVIFMVLGYFLGPRWFNVDPHHVNTLQSGFLVVSVGLFCSYYGQFWNILAQVNLDFSFISILRVIFTTLNIGGGLVLALSTRNVVLIIAWNSLLSVVQLFILVWHARHHYHFGIHLPLARLSRMKEMAGFTLKTFLSLVVNNILGGIDRLALGKLATPANFAHYTICSNIGQRVNGLSVSIMGPIFGNSSRAVGSGSGQRISDVYEESFDLMYPWIVLVAIWCILWRYPILTLWLGTDLARTVSPLLPPLIIAYCITSMANISGALFAPLDRVGLGLLIHILTGTFVVVCVYLGWRWAGIIGVAYGFLLSRVCLIAQDLLVIRLIQARGWWKPVRWLHISLQILLGALFYLLIAAWELPLIIQACLALLHGFGVASWLLRKDVTGLSSRIKTAVLAEER
jgi:O-antigen/teichoic acid export membrane protein